MSDYITTYTGNHIDPADPDPEAISIRDIAHALSLICRGNGHVRNFWSVGQHCLDCAHEAQARKLSPRMILACLLHDASECYMSDVPRPMKKHMQEYQRQEKGILKVIFEKFLGSDLTTAEIRELKEIDDALLWHDLETLLAEMHRFYERGYTPRVKPDKGCNACSLKELCLPKLMGRKSVSAYLRRAVEDTP